MLYAEKVTKDYGDGELFSDLDLVIGDGERVGLVGPNGAGKTTLLRLLAREDLPSRGSAGHRGGALGYLKQQTSFNPANTLVEEMWTAFPEANAAQARLDEIAGELERGSGDAGALVAEQSELFARFEALGGYEVHARIDRVLRGLGFAADEREKLCGDFSGGWRMRIGLAKILVHRPEHVLLDEPTNHLDRRSKEWLSGELAEYPGTAVIVTHDGGFLDRVATRILEIADGEVVSYAGNFSAYREQRAARIEARNQAAATQEREIARQQRFIERFRAKSSKARQVKSRERALERLSRVERHRELATAKFSLRSQGRTEREVLVIDSVSHAWDNEVVLLDVNLVVERGQKIVLVGPNGGGKSTLLRILAGQVAPLEGEVRWSERARPGYYAQHQDEALDSSRTVIDEVRVSANGATDGDIRGALAHFLFRGDDVFKRVGVLSGGERSRVALAKFLTQPTNVLLLDEPTNHLDAATRESLLSALDGYEGTVICASHDPGVLEIASHAYEVADGGLAEEFVR